MVKAIILDAGGVLHIWKDFPMHRDIKNTLEITDDEFNNIYPTLILTLVSGEITEEEFWRIFLNQLGNTRTLPSESLFLQEYVKQFRINEEVFDVLRILKNNGYILAVLSNSIAPHTNFNRHKGLYDIFDKEIISNEVGLIKPHEAIYRLALNKLKVKSEEAIFIDDMQVNIEAAEKIGIQSILFKSPGQMKEELIKYNVEL